MRAETVHSGAADRMQADRIPELEEILPNERTCSGMDGDRFRARKKYMTSSSWSHFSEKQLPMMHAARIRTVLLEH
jgi:hypothetical protein